jgi:hypothetical protein
VLKAGNKVKTVQVMARFAYGENSLGIRDVRMVAQNVMRCIHHESLPEVAAVFALAYMRLHLHNQLQQGHLLQL